MVVSLIKKLLKSPCFASPNKNAQEGRRALAMDLNHDPSTMDLMDPKGFISACYHATCLKPGSGTLAAPVCSTFVFMPPGATNFITVLCNSQMLYASVLRLLRKPSIKYGKHIVFW